MLFYNFFLQFTMNFQSFSHKRKTTLHRGPYTSHKIDSSEEAPADTIHMSHDFTDQPFPFFEFLREALDVNLEQRTPGNGRFSTRWSTTVEKTWRGSTRGVMRTEGIAQLGLGRPEACWPWKQAAAVAAASGGLASPWGREARRALECQGARAH